MRRKSVLQALIVAHACALASCGEENQTSVTSDPPCRTDIYPAAPDGASALVHVSAACPAVGADGSAAHPFPTIMEALPRAAAGAAILIAPGTYTENLTISQEVALVGSSDPTSPEAAAAVIEAKGEHAIKVTGDKKVTLRGLRVVKAVGTGIWVRKAPVTIEGCSIEGISVTTPDASGYGVASTDDASIILQNSAVTRAGGTGVYVGSAQAIILQSTIHGSGGPGVRIDRSTGQVRIEGSTIEDSTQIGIGVFSSRAIILQNVIKGTKLDSAGIGDGVNIASGDENGVPQGPADVELSGNEITNNARVGVLCAAGARGIILQNNAVDQNGSIAQMGAGIWLQQGAGDAPENSKNIIEGNTIFSNRFVGIGMVGDTHAIILQNNIISGTKAHSVFVGTELIEGGDGIGIFSSASAQLLENKLEKNGRFGLILDKANGAATTIKGNTFQDNDEYGIILQNQMSAPATTDNIFQGNTLGDMSSVSAGTFSVNTSDFAISESM